MDAKHRLEQLELNVAGLYDMLAGVTQMTGYLVENVLSETQKDEFIEWLAAHSAKRDTPGKVYLAQLGANICQQQRFIELMQLAGREFMDEKENAIREGRPIL